jgi:hypothetical protein
MPDNNWLGSAVWRGVAGLGAFFPFQEKARVEVLAREFGPMSREKGLRDVCSGVGLFAWTRARAAPIHPLVTTEAARDKARRIKDR